MQEAGTAELPPEIWAMIFDFFSHTDIYRMMRVCHHWNQMLRDEHIWQRFHDRVLGGKPAPPLLAGQWRESFAKNLRAISNAATPVDTIQIAVQLGAVVVVENFWQSKPGRIFGPAPFCMEDKLRITHSAIANGDIPMVQALIKVLPIDLCSARFGWNELIDPHLVACSGKRGNTDMMQFLHNLGLPLHGEKLLPIAIERTDLDVVMWLCERGVSVDCWHLAAGTAYLYVLKFFLYSPLTRAKVISNPSTVGKALEKILLSEKLSITDKGEAVNMLMKEKPIVATPERILAKYLLVTPKNQHPQALDALFALIKQHQQKSNPIQPYIRDCFVSRTAQMKDGVGVALINRLITELGWDINSGTHWDKRAHVTPLQWACIHGQLPLVQNLLQCGANPRISIMKEPQALYYAKKRGHNDIVALLKEHLPKWPMPPKPEKSMVPTRVQPTRGKRKEASSTPTTPTKEATTEEKKAKSKKRRVEENQMRVFF